MNRYRLTIEYDGGPFVGWQRQDNGLSVQQVMEEAAESFCGQSCLVQGSGRTDAGVHALGQVAHIDLPRDYPDHVVRFALNDHLKDWPVAILAAERAPEAFHARFSAIGRVYRYRILNRRSRPALDLGRVWWVPVPLDAGAMQAAADGLIGQHDFSSFRAAHCQAPSPVKTLDRLSVTRHGEEIWMEVAARSFLHNQVRIFAGTLKWAGEGKWDDTRVRQALEARDRAAAGPTAPPEGLYLQTVRYPENSPIPE